MGRTLATATQLLINEQRAFADFRRTLRRADQMAFDDLFSNARKHVAAISMAAHALPFESILLAMLLEEHIQNRLLVQQVEELLRLVETLDGTK